MKKIKVLFDGRYIMDGVKKSAVRSGIYWVCHNLYQELSCRKEVEMYLYTEDKYSTIHALPKVSKAVLLSDEDDLSDIDVFFSGHLRIPDCVREYPNITNFTILHDVIPLLFPSYFSGCDGSFKGMFNSLNREDWYFTNSNCTRMDFLKYSSEIDPDKVKTIPLSTNLDYKFIGGGKNLDLVKKKYHIPTDKKYVFSLCTLEPRKNLLRAVRTFVKFIKQDKINNLVFVLGGGHWDGFAKLLEAEIGSLKMYKDKIIRAGYIDDEDMNILYSNAEWFVYTSEYEGFGMPPLEAMACGCPVITSNNSSLPEVVGEAGIRIDYWSDEQHIEAYRAYYNDEKLRLENRKKGLERAKLFSWKNAVDIILDTIKKVQKLKNNQPLISVVLPCYDGVKADIEKQSYENIERVEVNCTLSVSQYDILNIALKTVKGKYVAYLEPTSHYADDTAIEVLVRKAEEQQADICFADAKIIDENNKTIIWCGKDRIYPLFGEIPNFQACLFKTDCLKENLKVSVDYKTCANTVLFYKLIKNNEHFVYCNKLAVVCDLKNDSPDLLELKRKAFGDIFGDEAVLSPYDVFKLAENHFLEFSPEYALNLGNKISRPEWREEYFKRLLLHYLKMDIAEIANAQQRNSFVIRCKLFNKILLCKIIGKKNRKWWRLLGFIPFIKVISKETKKKIYLFDHLPLLTLKRDKLKTKVYLFSCIPFLTIRKK